MSLVYTTVMTQSMKALILLATLMLVGLGLRLMYFSHTTFAYDQARDAFQALEIMSTDPIKIIGPTTDISGLFHGSLYWYIISIPYTLSQGNPLAVKLLMIVLHLFNIPLIYFITFKLTRYRLLAGLAAILMTFSFDAISYSRWMSNPTLATLSIAGFFYGLWLAFNKKSIGAGLMLIMWAFCVQFQFFLLYLMPLMFIGWYRLAKDLGVKNLFKVNNILMGCIGGILLVPFVISELKFGFQGTRSLLQFFFASNHTRSDFSLIGKEILFLDRLAGNIFYSFMGIHLNIARVFLVVLLSWIFFTIKKSAHMRPQKVLLLVWLLSAGIIYPFEKNNSYFLNIGNSYPLIILTLMMVFSWISKFSHRTRLALLSCVIGISLLGNLQLINQNAHGEVLFSVQNGIDLIDEYMLIDWMYEQAGDAQYSFSTVTNPLFINTTWAYLMNSYAFPKYKRLPYWAGSPIDQRHPGFNVKFSSVGFVEGMMHFVVIEPGPGIPDDYYHAFEQFENSRSTLIEKKKFGSFIVQKRRLTSAIHFSRDDIYAYSEIRRKERIARELRESTRD